MIVCLCKVVTDRQVHQAIDEGADSVEAVGQACGAGTGCGSCQVVVEELIEVRRECAGCPGQPQPFTAVASDRAA